MEKERDSFPTSFVYSSSHRVRVHGSDAEDLSRKVLHSNPKDVCRVLINGVSVIVFGKEDLDIPQLMLSLRISI